MASVEDLLAALARTGVTDGATLARLLGVSAPTLSRLVRRAEGRVLRMGRTRAARYAATRQLEGLGAELPVFRVDERGEAKPHGVLHLLARGSWHEHGADGALYEGLPPWAADMSPQGYLGRDFAARHGLALPGRLLDWTDDHRLLALVRRGEDCVGDLILGKESLDRHLAAKPQPVAVTDFPALARAAARGELGASSAAGEQPKFLAFVEGRHCLVKFAGADANDAAQRWRDLLSCEAAALETLAAHGLPAARARVLDVEGFRFLEVERFDRVGARGRRGVLSLFAIDNEYFGVGGTWLTLAERLGRSGRCAPSDARTLRWLDVFGQLTANTDRHLGNVSFFTGEGAWRLCPAYDTAPMLFAPSQATLVDRPFEPRGPTADTLDLWYEAAHAAEDFWTRVASRPDVSDSMKALARRAREALQQLR